MNNNSKKIIKFIYKENEHIWVEPCDLFLAGSLQVKWLMWSDDSSR